MSSPVHAGVGDAAARGTGAALAAVTSAAGRLRPATKPLHPFGVQLTGAMTREGSGEPWGAPWLDETGRDPVVVRLSRAVGLPARLPDVIGLALRVDHGERYTDLLFSSTGTGRVSRFLLVPRYSPATTYGTLMPYRSPTGAVLFGAELYPTAGADGIAAGATIVLSAARPRGAWQRFAVVDLDPPPPYGTDPAISFDPMLHPPLGLAPYRWVRELRERAYAAARRSRGDRS